MTPPSLSDPDAIRERLLKAKLGNLLTWRVPALTPTVGPFDTSVFDAFDKDRELLVETVRARLEAYTSEELALLMDGRSDPAKALVSSWRSFEADRIQRMKTQEPSWYAGGFGHPDYQADFDYWAKMPHFVVDELACVSIGVEPQHFPRFVLDAILKKDLGELRPQLPFLRRRYEQLKRQFDPQGLRWTVTPKEFIAWVDRVEFDVHSEFIRRLRRHNGEVPSDKAPLAPALAEADKREIDKIAQLFTAIVIREYGYDPTQSRSPIPREIADIAAELGLSATPETIRKYLRLGAGFLPEDWQPK